MYPALLALVSIGMMALLLVYIVPDIVKVFVSRGADLPFLTKALIAVSWFLQNFGLYLLLGIAVAGLLFLRWARVPANRLRIDRFFSETPRSRSWRAAGTWRSAARSWTG
ncbi:hypothetical protein [Escherichia coli]|uniref:hypothetical protein n=1 Tax=Escherichia coli TaxID=562 RepID=UPI001A996D75|nr:hypothetical protein [Escherichia coli]